MKGSFKVTCGTPTCIHQFAPVLILRGYGVRPPSQQSPGARTQHHRPDHMHCMACVATSSSADVLWTQAQLHNLATTQTASTQTASQEETPLWSKRHHNVLSYACEFDAGYWLHLITEPHKGRRHTANQLLGATVPCGCYVIVKSMLGAGRASTT